MAVEIFMYVHGKGRHSSALTAGLGGYRPVSIPSDTARRFEEVALQNTRRNTETCGILAGKLVNPFCINPFH